MQRYTGDNGEQMVVYEADEIAAIAAIAAERSAEIAALTDEEIDYSDIPPLDDEFWQKAVIVLP